MADKEFTIKRKNLTALKQKKEATVNKDAPKTSPATDPAKPTTRTQYEKRKPLNKVESEFLKDFYYKRSGFAGRDVLYKQLQAH